MSTATQNLVDKIADVLQVKPGEVSLKSQSTDFPGWDSMAIVELVFMLERDYEVTVPLQQSKTLHSVAGVMQVLQAAGKL